mmetsp:Transcript_42648/g.121583  ORF Transcript_42648/g.121583 Transcript_42648/m.121583 type:complete len:225 (+) Transcript_42648:2-676(+)
MTPITLKNPGGCIAAHALMLGRSLPGIPAAVHNALFNTYKKKRKLRLNKKFASYGRKKQAENGHMLSTEATASPAAESAAWGSQAQKDTCPPTPALPSRPAPRRSQSADSWKTSSTRQSACPLAGKTRQTQLLGPSHEAPMEGAMRLACRQAAPVCPRGARCVLARGRGLWRQPGRGGQTRTRPRRARAGHGGARSAVLQRHHQQHWQQRLPGHRGVLRLRALR